MDLCPLPSIFPLLLCLYGFAEVENHTTSQLAVEMMESLQLRDVRTFWASDRYLSSADWTSISKIMPNIESLYIAERPDDSFLDIISLNTRHTDEMASPFSKLRMLGLWLSRYSDEGEPRSSLLEAVVCALRSRKDQGMELERLVIKDGSGMDTLLAERLREVVKYLEWTPQPPTGP